AAPLPVVARSAVRARLPRLPQSSPGGSGGPSAADAGGVGVRGHGPPRLRRRTRLAPRVNIRLAARRSRALHFGDCHAISRQHPESTPSGAAEAGASESGRFILRAVRAARRVVARRLHRTTPQLPLVGL